MNPRLWPATKRLLIALIPLLLVGLFYESMGFIHLRSPITHDCDLRAIEIRFFGITLDGQPATVHDFWNQHSSTALDLFCAIPYGSFLGAVVALAIFLFLKDYEAMKRFTWCFFALNVVGFATYQIYPAAPPWYFHKYGCTIDLLAKASEGPHLAHVDRILGFRYFGNFYGKSKNVFGAVPSLHCAYPMVIALSGWRSFAPWGRACAFIFYFWMCFAAVYLDHHWIVDVLLGSTYGLLVFAFVRFVTARRPRES